MKKVLILALIALVEVSVGQTRGVSMPKVTGVRVTYTSEVHKMPFYEVVTFGAQSVSREVGKQGVDYVDYARKERLKIVVNSKGDTIIGKQRVKYPKNRLVGQKEMINGWECEHYKIKIAGKFLDVWATKSVGFYGTPDPNIIVEGLVLKIVGDHVVIFNADYVDRLTEVKDIMPKEKIANKRKLNKCR